MRVLPNLHELKIFILLKTLFNEISNNGTPSPTRTDMNRSSTDFESVALGLKPFITLTFIVCINVLYQYFFFKISKNIPMNVKSITLKIKGVGLYL